MVILSSSQVDYMKLHDIHYKQPEPPDHAIHFSLYTLSFSNIINPLQHSINKINSYFLK